MDAKAVLKYSEDHEAKFVSVRFTDLVGAWHHLTFPIHELDEGSFEDGFGFDASSLRGWASIHESDMLLIPDPCRVWMDPFAEEPTLAVIANAVDPITKEGYGLDPRSVAQRAESYLRFTGIADTVNFGPEAEFFVFDGVEVNNEPHHSRLPHSFRRGPSGRRGAARTTSAAPTSATASATRRATCPSRRPTRSERPALRDFADAGGVRHHGRVPPPRGRDRRPVRDRLPLLDDARHGRQPANLQVRRPQRRAPVRQGGDLHAEADVRRQRLRDALPPDRSGRARSLCSRATATRGSPTWRAGTSAAS